MITKQPIILIGGGGHCKSCIDVIEQEAKYQIVGIIEKGDEKGRNVIGYDIIGTDDDLPKLLETYRNFLITIGQIQSPITRINIFNRLTELGAYLPVIISPFAYASKHSKIGNGTIVMHHAIINAGVQIGPNCIINTKTLIEHDVIIEDHCHIATGSIINGGCRVGQGTFIGSNAVIKEYVSIGEKSFVGMGSVVVNNVPENRNVLGAPARVVTR